MAAGERIEGRCLCGAVTFAAALDDGAMHACHCESCRRWTGGVYLFLPVKNDSLAVIDPKGSLGLYRSSEWAERGFCKACGASLFFRLLDGSSTDVSAQAVEEPGRFPFASEVFIDEKPGNYAFADATEKLTGAQSMAKLGNPQEAANV